MQDIPTFTQFYAYSKCIFMLLDIEYTWVPLQMDLTQHLSLERGAAECKQLLPERAFHSSSMLIDALSSVLGIGEDLCLGIRDLLKESHTLVAEVVDDWLQLAGLTRHQYLAKVVNCGASINGLFVWLAAVFSGKHLNIMHATGIWTLHATEIVVMTDVVLIYIIRCFCLHQPCI